MSDEVWHYGVKGMKWGIRKDRYESNSRLRKGYTISKGSELQNISADAPREIKNGYAPIYASNNRKDNLNYEAFYSNFLGGDTYRNTLTVQKNIKVASQKEAVEEFSKMVAEDPKGYGKALAKAGVGQTLPSMLFAPYGIIKRHSTAKKFRNAGKEWLETEGYNGFVNVMGTNNANSIREKYFKRLSDKGYGAIFDTFDINSGVSDEPIILINPSRDITNTKSVVLTQNDIDKARDEYSKLIKR